MNFRLTTLCFLVCATFASAEGPITPVISKNIPYVTHGHERQKLDLFVPSDAPASCPLLVWIHGGAWKEGSKEKIHGAGSTGLLSSRLTLEGPLVKNKSSFLISARRTYFDLLTKPLLPANSRGGYYFYDLNAKVNYEFSKKNKIYLSGYFGKDKF